MYAHVDSIVIVIIIQEIGILLYIQKIIMSAMNFSALSRPKLLNLRIVDLCVFSKMWMSDSYLGSEPALLT